MNILVTGAGGGLGHAATKELLQRGHTVVANIKHSKQRVLFETHPNLSFLEGDITDAEDRRRMGEARADVLIHAAAIGSGGPLYKLAEKDVRQVMETNVIATLLLVQSWLDHLPEGTPSPRLILFSSVVGKVALPYLGAYPMSKFAIEGMGDTLRRELAPQGIHVSLIEPGAIATGFNEQMASTPPKAGMSTAEIERMKHAQATLIKNQHSANSVTRAVMHAVHATSPKARYIAPRSYALSVLASKLLPDRFVDAILQRRLR